MSPHALLQLGLQGLLTHKLRSALSILGVVFGVAAVVAMSSVGEGARREALAQVGALGIDSVTVRGRPGAGRGRPLGVEDAQAVAAVAPHAVGVAPLRAARLLLDAGGRETQAAVVGTTPAYAMAARLRLAAGRFLSDLDLSDRKRVAVLGAATARRLAPLGDLLGEPIRIGGDWFTVVGVLEGRAVPRSRGLPIRARDVNQAVFVPLPSLDRGAAGGPDTIDEIALRVDAEGDVVACAEVVRRLLRRSTGAEDFEIVVPREILRQRERTQRVFNVVTGAVAAIGLLVGGIGIMNIMLASVAERTHEIGVRRACGATRRAIGSQFLVESSLLTGFGGVLGAVSGIVAAYLIQRFADWPTALSFAMLLGSLLMAVGVGIGFGFYPARRAAQLEPIEALRRE